jgi:transcription termination/antitermination protein NusG
MDRFTPAGHSWNVLYTKPQHEKKVSEILSKRNIENYLPLKRISAPWWMPWKGHEAPLFDSIVFVKTDAETGKQIKHIDGVVNWLYWLGKPYELEDLDIVTLKSFLYSHSDVTIEKIAVPLSYTNVADEKKASLLQNELKIEVPALGYRLIAEQNDSNIMVISFDKGVTPLNTPYSHAS